MKDEDGTTGVCTAFVIDNNYAVTAAHCLVESPKKLLMWDDSGQFSQVVTVAAYASGYDLGLLLGDFTKFNKMNIITDQPVGNLLRGQPVLSCGFPHGSHTGVCTQAQILGPHNGGLIAEGEAYPGMSGGPVIEPTSMVVVALNTALYGLYNNLPPDTLYFSPLIGLFDMFNIK
jgi:hypothetical protein